MKVKVAAVCLHARFISVNVRAGRGGTRRATARCRGEERETGTEPWTQEETERLSGNRLHLEDKRMQREREVVVSEN